MFCRCSYIISLLAFLSFFAGSGAEQGLNITAISAANGESTLECWNLFSPPGDFAGAANYPIGNFEGAFIGVLPPQTYIGQAWARTYHRYSLVLSGLVHITLPNSKHEAWLQGGQYGLLIAADLKNTSKSGHITDFPAKDQTVIAQFPILGDLPEHAVLYKGPCKLPELIGL
ncbi:hypothetical protein BT63DRAFT_397038 [Microthyrium microscopicum]|uniref:Small secreted protein n=1 Tax=Microthyrium microscopicum TaxID=703497 RepID=A0A6A6UNB5_9PEZI|nr:hypothetical protein BT63DRAFT_397038 [Microthyrium microscopicum]